MSILLQLQAAGYSCVLQDMIGVNFCSQLRFQSIRSSVFSVVQVNRVMTDKKVAVENCSMICQ